MLKRIKLCLCGLVILAFLISANIASGDDADVAICTIVYPFGVDVGVVPKIEDAIQGAVDVQLFGEDDLDGLADWVEAHTSSQNNILIITGILPSTIYAAGNAEPDGSPLEEFLDAGNTIINTGEYFAYTIEGGNEANERSAIGLILDVPPTQGIQIDWDGGATTLTPTADGGTYTPSVEEYSTCYPMHMIDFDGTPWELDIVVAENTDRDGDLRFDGVVANTETGGRFGGFVQAAWCGQTGAWRGDVISEYILNYHLTEVADFAVQADGKLVSTWGEIKERRGK